VRMNCALHNQNPQKWEMINHPSAQFSSSAIAEVCKFELPKP